MAIRPRVRTRRPFRLEVTAAVWMLTRVPVGRADPDSTGAAAYGLIGAVVGVAAAVPMLLLGDTAPTLAAVLAVATATVLSGALHLDGLADTADALMARDRAAAELARKDPAIGVGGVVALIVVLLAEVAALAAVGQAAGAIVAGLTVVAVGGASRTLPVVVAATVAPESGRPGGLGSWFADQVDVRHATAAVVTTVVVTAGAAAVAGSAALVVGVAAGAAAALGLARWLLRARGGLDGDLLGATVVLGEMAMLVVTAVTVSVAWPGR